MSWLRTLLPLALILATADAMAAPPSSCASKFVGTWQHGTSNIATLTPDGQALCSGNAFCLQGTWTCSGNSLTYYNGAGTYVYTLQPSGEMTYGSIVVRRIGGGGQVASQPTKPAAPAAPPAKLGGDTSAPLQTEYRPSGSQPLQAGKQIAGDPPPKGSNLGQKKPADEICGSIVSSRPTQCANEPDGKNCTCLSVSNKCAYPVTVFFAFLGRACHGRYCTNGSFGLESGASDSRSACTSRANESIRYLGYRKG